MHHVTSLRERCRLFVEHRMNPAGNGLVLSVANFVQEEKMLQREHDANLVRKYSERAADEILMQAIEE